MNSYVLNFQEIDKTKFSMVGHNFYVDVFEDQPLDLKEIPVTNIERSYES